MHGDEIPHRSPRRRTASLAIMVYSYRMVSARPRTRMTLASTIALPIIFALLDDIASLLLCGAPGIEQPEFNGTTLTLPAARAGANAKGVAHATRLPTSPSGRA